jgi:nucleoid-associated protein Lsr2
MPRSTEQILAHADELARRFAEHEPASDRIMDARALRDIATAVERRAVEERNIAAAIILARTEGHSWAAIGAMLGTSGEAARQRYGSAAAHAAHGQWQHLAGHAAGSQHPQGAEAAQGVSVLLEDDLDGGPIGETLRFGFDGIEYELDLDEKKAAAFRKHLAQLVKHARKAERGRTRRTTRTGASRQSSGDIRGWAKQHGIAVSERGRIPASVMEQYYAALKDTD